MREFVVAIMGEKDIWVRSDCRSVWIPFKNVSDVLCSCEYFFGLGNSEEIRNGESGGLIDSEVCFIKSFTKESP